MKTTGNRMSGMIAGALLLVLAGGSALAQTTNYWTNAVGTATWTTAGNWNPSSVPGTAQNNYVKWTNNAAVPYTVQFTGYTTSGLAQVTSDKVTFDLNGQLWRAPSTADGTPLVANFFGVNAGETSTVTFSSSAAPVGANGNTVDFGGGNYPGGTQFGNGTPASTLLISTNLGYGVKVILPADSFFYGGNVKIHGPGSQLSQPYGIFHTWSGNIQVEDGGVLDITASYSALSFSAHTPAGSGTATVNNATLITRGSAVANAAYSNPGGVILTNNAKWIAGTAGIGTADMRYYAPATVPYIGTIYANGSQIFDAGGLKIGDTVGSYGYALGYVTIANGSTLAISNGNLVVHAPTYTTGGVTYSNTLVLANSSIYLGQTGVNGALTNRGVLRASGTITGNGAGNFLLRNEGEFHVGNSPGVLTLNKGNLESAANSKTYFEFGDTALSQIVAANGYASLLGTNLFSLAAGAPAPVPGVKYGLGTYNFVIGTNVTSTPQYDNLVNLLTNNYHLTYGVDFHYGVVNLGGGLFALELTFVPEPSSVLLLALGGLMIWRRMAKRGKTVVGS